MAALVRLMASLSLCCVSTRTWCSSSRAVSTGSRTCSRRGRFSRLSKRHWHKRMGLSLSASACSSTASDERWAARELSMDCCLRFSFSIKRWVFLTFWPIVLCTWS